jgi:hypothetical protein
MKNPMTSLNRYTGRRTAFAVALLSVTGVTACNQEKLLTVPTPDVVRPSDLSSAAALPNAYAATVGDFAIAYAGSARANEEGLVNMSGLLSDEFYDAETFPTRVEVDLRKTNPINGTMLVLFQNLHRARATAELVSSRYAALDSLNPNRVEVQALEAYTYLLFAENYCNGVPTSRVVNGTFVYGDPLTGAQQLVIAIAKFDSAITLATRIGGSANTAQYLARVGKARAQLAQGSFAAAAATVASVPTSFAYNIGHDENTPRQNNGVFGYTFAQKRFSVAGGEGVNGLPFNSSGDPRIGAYRNGGGFTAAIDYYQTAKYQGTPAGTRNAPTPLALGTEARLIEAEAALAANDDATLLSKLNEARANSKTYIKGNAPTPPPPAPLTLLDLGTSAQSRQNLLFSERAFDLYLTAHRVGDLRRLIRAPYSRGAETVFPTGQHQWQPGAYGTDVNFPVPFEEQNNSKFTQCIDRAP